MDFETILKFIVLCLACWRLSSLFAVETGPFDMFVKIQRFLASKKGALFKTLSGGIMCMWCNSVWFGFLLSFTISRNALDVMIYTLAISAGSIAIGRIING